MEINEDHPDENKHVIHSELAAVSHHHLLLAETKAGGVGELQNG